MWSTPRVVDQPPLPASSARHRGATSGRRPSPAYSATVSSSGPGVGVAGPQQGVDLERGPAGRRGVDARVVDDALEDRQRTDPHGPCVYAPAPVGQRPSRVAACLGAGDGAAAAGNATRARTAIDQSRTAMPPGDDPADAAALAGYAGAGRRRRRGHPRLGRAVGARGCSPPRPIAVDDDLSRRCRRRGRGPRRRGRPGAAAAGHRHRRPAGNPLAVLRTLVRYPTAVLRSAGARPVDRDDFTSALPRRRVRPAPRPSPTSTLRCTSRAAVGCRQGPRPPGPAAPRGQAVASDGGPAPACGGAHRGDGG